jgi:hypothetical protein
MRHAIGAGLRGLFGVTTTGKIAGSSLVQKYAHAITKGVGGATR